MTETMYMEDILLDFFLYHSIHGFVNHTPDYRVIHNFVHLIKNNESLTQSQAALAVKLLKKYSLQCKNLNFDYEKNLKTPVWRNAFRVIDLSKRIFVKIEEDNQLTICLKFPFGLKDEFLSIFSSKNSIADLSSWDPDEKIRKVNANDINIIHLHDWASSNGFEFDENFINLVFEAENAWENEDKIIPHSVIFENSVVLQNSNQSADLYFEENCKNEIYHDMLLAKFMNFPLKIRKPQNITEKIASSSHNIFWLKNNFDFFRLIKNIEGKICLILDRAASREDWLKKFVTDSQNFGVPAGDIKVCFRHSSDDRSNFNTWVKENGLGGSVGSGKLLIFEDKPAKWLFRDNVDVKIIVTNNLFSNSTMWVNDWMMSHPCVIYLGEHKPTLTKVKDIAVL